MNQSRNCDGFRVNPIPTPFLGWSPDPLVPGYPLLSRLTDWLAVKACPRSQDHPVSQEPAFRLVPTTAPLVYSATSLPRWSRVPTASPYDVEVIGPSGVGRIRYDYSQRMARPPEAPDRGGHAAHAYRMLTYWIIKR